MRVSVTTLEQFRRYMAGLCWCKEDCTCEAQLIASIKGEFIPTPRMEAGSLFHRAMETLQPEGLIAGDFLAALEACDGGRVAKALVEQRGVPEAKFTRRFGDVLVVGKADLLLPPAAYDWKATEGYSGGDYTDSLQWRFTLAALPELTVFRYENFRLWQEIVAPLHDGSSADECDTIPPYSVKYLPPGQEFSRYPALVADCEAWVRHFEGYISLRGLGEFVADKDSNEFPEVAA